VSKLPSTITYLIGIDHGRVRAMCVEASAPTRLNAFVRRTGGIQLVRQEYGLDHDGVALSPDRQMRLARQIYRNARPPARRSPPVIISHKGHHEIHA
jgi:hypothetical protein